MRSIRKDQKEGPYKKWSRIETMLRDPSPRGGKLKFMRMVAEEEQWLAGKQKAREMKTGFRGFSLSLALVSFRFLGGG